MLVFPPPPIRGLGNNAGFQIQLEDRGGVGLDELNRLVQEVVEDASAQSGLRNVNSTFRAAVPQLLADIDREKVKTLDLRLTDVFTTLQAYLGSTYVNDFNKFGRTYQVRVQGESLARAEPEDIQRLEVRNREGAMIPLGTVVKVEEKQGPQIINRYNLYPSALDHRRGGAREAARARPWTWSSRCSAASCRPSMGYDWTAMSFQEKRVGGEAVWVFAPGRAAGLPGARRPVRELAAAGGGDPGRAAGPARRAAAVAIRGMDNNVYTQIGIVLIIALASKNAILIVEFARDLRARGRTIREAAVEAARLRFRPILMTSFAFILGVSPLVIAEGAGAASRQALGTAVFGGMIASTVLAVFFVPVFFVVFQYAERMAAPAGPGRGGGGERRAASPRRGRGRRQRVHPLI